MNSRLNLLILRTGNQERLKNFYQDLFDKHFELHTDHGPRHYGARFGEVYIEIYQTSKELKQLDGLGFVVENLEEFLKKVDKENIHKKIQSALDERSAIIRDPDNRLIYLTEKA